MENKDFTLTSQAPEKGTSNNDFEFVKEGSRVYEQPFQSKPQSFFKDAMKRFVKSKSSLVGFIIIGILFLMSIIVPLADTNDIDTVDKDIQFLAPKIQGFDKLGFMDGGKNVKAVIADQDGNPVGYSKDSVMNKPVYYTSYETTPSQYGSGGVVIFSPDQGVPAEVISPFFNLNFATGDYTLSIKTDEVSDVAFNLVLNLPLPDGSDTVKATVFTNESSATTLDGVSTYSMTGEAFKALVNKAMGSKALDTVDNVTFTLNVTKGSLAMHSFSFKNTKDKEDVANSISFASGNDYGISINPWSITTGAFAFQNIAIKKMDFRYNTYSVLGFQKGFSLSSTEMNIYIQNGWVSYDYNVGPSSFKILNAEKAPVTKVNSQKKEDAGYTLDVDIWIYRYKGFDQIPAYFFGTNQNGLDFFKLVFTGLRTSFFLGLAVTIICLVFGMVWGSVSAYFGGTVDILMERFTDILGGVPWIVIMTLCVLSLGNKFSVFLLALCLTGWIGVAVSMRSQVYRYKRREFVMASRTLGASDARLIFKHIVPNAVGPIVTSAVLMVPSIILSEASISYLGLGLKGLVSLGVTISEAQNYLSQASFLTVCSSIVIAALMICFNLFGNGLRDAFNPSLKGSDE